MADSDPAIEVSKDDNKTIAPKQPSKFKAQAAARKTTRKQKYIKDMNDNGIIDMWISKAEDERTAMAKTSTRSKNHSDKRHEKPSLLEKGFGLGRTVATAARRLFQQMKRGSTKTVRFESKPSVQTFGDNDKAIMITYDSGADGSYMSKDDRATLGLPILRQSTR